MGKVPKELPLNQCLQESSSFKASLAKGGGAACLVRLVGGGREASLSPASPPDGIKMDLEWIEKTIAKENFPLSFFLRGGFVMGHFPPPQKADCKFLSFSRNSKEIFSSRSEGGERAKGVTNSNLKSCVW